MSLGSLIVVSDRCGFVGAFAKLKQAQASLKAYPGIPFVYTSWPRRAAKSESVWIIPYAANSVVAYASDSKTAAAHVQKVLMRLDLVPSDDIENWKAGLGEVHPAALRRLDETVLARKTSESPELQAKDQKLVDRFLDLAEGKDPPPTKAGPAEKIDLLKSVVPRALKHD